MLSWPPGLLHSGLFGSGIRSYFTFLRFLLLLNLLTVLLTANFVLLPLAWLQPPDPNPALNLSECWMDGLDSLDPTWACCLCPALDSP